MVKHTSNLAGVPWNCSTCSRAQVEEQSLLQKTEEKRRNSEEKFQSCYLFSCKYDDYSNGETWCLGLCHVPARTGELIFPER